MMICLQTADVVDVMSRISGFHLKSLKVDGGATQNDFLMQLQADLLGIQVERPAIIETTALGAAFLAGLTVEHWQGLDELRQLRRIDRVFRPSMPEEKRVRIRHDWKRAIARAQHWTNPA